MRTMDECFVRDFKEMMAARRSVCQGANIPGLPVPKFDKAVAGELKGHMFLIRGIKEEYFDKLNGEEVQQVAKGNLTKRIAGSDGKFLLDKKGQPRTQDVTVPSGSIVILSSRSIGLKNWVMVKGEKKKHKPTEGFAYVDFVETKSGRKYMYIIPKNYVYRLNMCALVLTPNTRRVFYKGSRLALQNGSYIFMYVVPYTYRNSQEARVIGIKSSPNFDEEVRMLLEGWVHRGVLFNPSLTQLDEQVGGLVNVGLQDIGGTVAVEDWSKYGVSLAEEKENQFEDQVGLI